MAKSKDNLFSRCLYFNSNALTRKLNARWNHAFDKFDLSPSHGYLLRLILSSPGLSQQAISDQLNLEKSTVARFLSKLESDKLVERRESKGDPRQKCVYPSKQAIGMEDDLLTLGDELYLSMCEKIGAHNVRKIVASLREVADKL